MSFTLQQQKTLAITPHVTGSLSVFGSASILRGILSDEKKRKNTYHRILAAMSAMDIVVSFWYTMSTIPIPSGTEGVWGASGNTSSCNAQGFFIQVVSGIPCYNAALSVYCFLACRSKWTEERIRSIEPLLLGVPFCIGWGTALVGLPLKLYNNASLWCWIAEFPRGCNDSIRYGVEANCVRGNNAFIYRALFAMIPVWGSIIVATTCMSLVYCKTLQHERAVDQFQEEGVLVRKQSKRVAWQAFFYLLVFYITFVPSTIVRILQTLPQTQHLDFFPLVFIMTLCNPSQGFLNFIVYARGRYYMYRRENPRASILEATRVAAFAVDQSLLHSRRSGVENTAGNPETSAPSPIATEAILENEESHFSHSKQPAKIYC